MLIFIFTAGKTSLDVHVFLFCVDEPLPLQLFFDLNVCILCTIISMKDPIFLGDLQLHVAETDWTYATTAKRDNKTKR